MPFVAILFALYTIAGGICVRGSFVGTPALNTGILALGRALASIMGTTGASMLLIRPLLTANECARHKVHTVVFFILLVGNVGGALSPLGDPPLFIGFLKGVDFFWDARNLAPPTALLAGRAARHLFRCSTCGSTARTAAPHAPRTGGPALRGRGRVQSAADRRGDRRRADVGPVDIRASSSTCWARTCRSRTCCATSRWSRWRWLRSRSRRRRSASTTRSTGGRSSRSRRSSPASSSRSFRCSRCWRRAATARSAALADLVVDAAGEPRNVAVFWVTGVLSAFLDNAPTYLVFFNLAGGDAAELMGPRTRDAARRSRWAPCTSARSPTSATRPIS